MTPVDALTDEVHDVVQQYALLQQTLTYGELVRLIRTRKLIANGKPLADALTAISRREHQRKRGMLSVLVVNKALGRPSDPFFGLARDLCGVTVDTDQQKVAFFEAERDRVFKAWSLSLAR